MWFVRQRVHILKTGTVGVVSYKKEQDCSSNLSGVEKTVLIPLREFVLKSTERELP